jgi:protein kinase
MCASSPNQYAVKCMKATFSDWNEVRKQRELQAILALCRPDSTAGEYLVQVFEIIRESDSKLYFVCEFMPDGDLKDFLARHKTHGRVVDAETTKSILRQVVLGLLYIHSKGFMHRDLKPENLLMSGNRCKGADFSLARLSSSATTGPMTTYVSSRWYRAPELVLEAKEYTTAIDMFALGCVMGEILTLEPLFPGRDEHDQFPVMMALLGPIHASDWPAGVIMVEKLGLATLGAPPRDIQDTPIPLRLAEKLRITDSGAISLLDCLLKLNPSSRPSADSVLKHSYFAGQYSVPQAMDGNLDFDLPPWSTPLFGVTPIKQQRPGIVPVDPYQRAPMVSVSPAKRMTTHARVQIGKHGYNGTTSSRLKAEMIGQVLRPCQTFGID